MRILYHIGFWLSFIMLFVYQNPGADYEEYLAWFSLMTIAAAIVYTNLYVLLPQFYFKKKYLIYLGSLSLLILLGSLLISWGITFNNRFDRENTLIQNSINLLFFVIITSSAKFYREYQRKQALLILAENEQLKTELKLLKAQVNPHFLFNTLSNLYGLILQNENDEAAAVTLKLSDLMRYLLQSSKRDKVPLSEEIKFIEDYLSLERIRLSQQADIQFKVVGLEGEMSIAPLVFIPLVENAFKHGLQSLSDQGFAHFTLAQQGNDIFFEATNSLGKHLNRVPSGTGLDNLRKRLGLMYPNQHIFEMEKDQTQFKVSLQITL